MKPLRSEDLEHLLEIRRATKAKDGKGGWTSGWATIAEPWAEVTALDGRESVMDHVLEGDSFYRIRIRWRAGVNTNDQVRGYGDRELNITSGADPDGRREQLVILADTRGVKPSA